MKNAISDGCNAVVIYVDGQDWIGSLGAYKDWSDHNLYSFILSISSFLWQVGPKRSGGMSDAFLHFNMGAGPSPTLPPPISLPVEHQRASPSSIS